MIMTESEMERRIAWNAALDELDNDHDDRQVEDHPQGPKYPMLSIESSQNTSLMIGRVRKVLLRHGVSYEEIAEFTHDARSGDADHALQTIMGWVDVE